VDNKVPEMDWLVWDKLERLLHSRPQRPTSLTALATALQEERAAIPPETFRHLVSPPGINVHD
jgi:hypothetical protein